MTDWAKIITTVTIFFVVAATGFLLGYKLSEPVYRAFHYDPLFDTEDEVRGNTIKIDINLPANGLVNPNPAVISPIVEQPQETVEVTSAETPSRCPADWSYLGATGFCYKEYEKPNLSWEAAEAECLNAGAHLASIHSAEENEFLVALAAKGSQFFNSFIGVAQETWIGLHSVVKGEWVWSDGTEMDFFNWGPDQPDYPDEEFCVQLMADRPTWADADSWHKSWNNANCTTDVRSFICKMPANGILF